MKLYINGDSHTAAAEAVNPHAFAEDDSQYFYLGRAPHPANAAVSWPKVLSQLLKAVLHNDSESASSNRRIMRTTRDWMRLNERWLPETVIIISWSTWEREEWLIDGTYYQLTASGIDDVPHSHQDRYRQYIADIDWMRCSQAWHQEIWDFHQQLLNHRVRHVFFNGNTHFGNIPILNRQDWGANYVQPYQADQTYDQWLKNHGYLTVSPNSWHFGKDAHAAWAQNMLQYGIQHALWSP